MAIVEAARPGPVEAPTRPARSAVPVARALMLIASIVLISAGAILVTSQPSVDRGNTKCARAVTAVIGGGANEPREYLDSVVLRPELAAQAWEHTNSACVRALRIRFSEGMMLVLAGVTLLLFRRRIPGSRRASRREKRLPRWFFTAAAVEVMLAVVLAVTLHSAPARAVARYDPPALPSPLPASLVAVEHALGQLGYGQASISEYGITGIAPDALANFTVTMRAPSGPGSVTIHYIRVNPHDTVAAASAAARKWAGQQALRNPSATTRDGWFFPRSGSTDTVGWTHAPAELFIVDRFSPIPTGLTPPQLLHRLAG